MMCKVGLQFIIHKVSIRNVTHCVFEQTFHIRKFIAHFPTVLDSYFKSNRMINKTYNKSNARLCF